MLKDVVHNVEKYQRFLYTGYYSISFKIPMYFFINDYPYKPKNLGEKIRKSRIDSIVQVKDFAKVIGVTSDTVMDWEKGRAKPSTANLNLICSII